jgi:hypothetical protein
MGVWVGAGVEASALECYKVFIVAHPQLLGQDSMPSAHEHTMHWHAACSCVQAQNELKSQLIQALAAIGRVLHTIHECPHLMVLLHCTKSSPLQSRRIFLHLILKVTS